MQLQGNITINGRDYRKGDYVSPFAIYPFFLIHMLMFGGSGFMMAYFVDAPVLFLYAHGGFAILIYTVFYFSIFGIDQVKWMAINAGLGLLGIYAEVDLLLSAFDKDILSFPFYVHVIPFLYYILYTFLLRQAILDITGSRNDETRKKLIEKGYIAISLAVYLGLYIYGR